MIVNFWESDPESEFELWVLTQQPWLMQHVIHLNYISFSTK